ncbi:hypothetical protein [Streptodolium elevatio]|uniref:Uncharacterized protein n=1 Tax=Streptodolium elevatio TaxID=3157996 RepID=A0ABV3DJA9_9ACTN
MELLSDMYFRIVGTPTPPLGRKATPAQHLRRADLRNAEFVSAPEDHIRQMGNLALDFQPYLLARPLTIMELTAGALVSGDEPVVLNQSEDYPAPLLPPRRRIRSRRRRGQRIPRPRRELIQVQNKRGGIALAEEIVMPVGPRTAVVYGPPGSTAPPLVQLAQDDSLAAAAELNAMLLEQTYFFAYCHPDGRFLLEAELPDVGALMNVGGATPEQTRRATAEQVRLRPMLHRDRITPRDPRHR